MAQRTHTYTATQALLNEGLIAFCWERGYNGKKLPDETQSQFFDRMLNLEMVETIKRKRNFDRKQAAEDQTNAETILFT